MSSACRVASLIRRLDPRQQVDQLAPAHRAVARIGDRGGEQRLEAVVEVQAELIPLQTAFHLCSAPL